MQDPAARAANQQRRSLLGLAFIVIAVSALAGYLIFGAVQSDRGGQTLTVRPDVQPDLTAEPAGMYFVVLQTSEGAITKRIMVE